MRRVLTTGVFLILFWILAINVMSMPGHDSVEAPAYNETTEHYLRRSLEETGATNIVAAILTDYRAFDTLGETIVLFTSIVAVVSVLRPDKKPDEEDTDHA